jgi:glycosyltransferase involved in cell wall biosynthesis
MRANRAAYRLAHRVVGNSPSVSHLVETEGGVPAARVVTIPNFLDPRTFEPPFSDERCRLLAELEVPSGAFVVGIVARLSAVKDHPTLLRAVAMLRRELADVHCVLVGDGPERERLSELAGTLEISDAVHFAGQRQQLPNLHHLFDVSVLCSTSEASPNSVLEAMAAARPVVATAVGGTPDAVHDGVTGLLVPAGDSDRLAAALRLLHDDGARRAAYGAAGREVARADYGEEVVIAKVETLYLQLAGRAVA